VAGTSALQALPRMDGRALACSKRYITNLLAIVAGNSESVGVKWRRPYRNSPWKSRQKQIGMYQIPPRGSFGRSWWWWLIFFLFPIPFGHWWLTIICLALFVALMTWLLRYE
jgi:hypothetical protein